MDFDNVRFPVRVSLDAVGGPRFKTSVASMASGAEQRIQWWENDRGEWTVSFHTKLPKEWRPLIAFFRAIARGRANTFRFKDWTDFTCEDGDGFFALIEGTSPAAYQMVKRYTFFGIDGTPYTYDRIIRKPIEGKVTTTATGLDYSTGIASSDGAWYGEFDCMVRLDNDPMRCQIVNRNPSEGLIIGWDGIEIIEVIGDDGESS